MMRFAETRRPPTSRRRRKIVELHPRDEVDAPSGKTARATAKRLGGLGWRSTRCGCLAWVAHQEVLFGGIGESN